MSEATVADTRRLNSKPQDLTDAYGPPSNFLEIDVFDPQTIGVGRNRFTTYEVRMKVGGWTGVFVRAAARFGLVSLRANMLIIASVKSLVKSTLPTLL